MFLLRRLIVLTCTSLLFIGVPAAAGTISINFETLPGPDGVLGTADDIPTANTFLQPLGNLYTSIGLNFEQGSLLQGDFFDGNPANHFISSTNPIGDFSIPVFGISIQSHSLWNATLTAYNAKGEVIATDTLLDAAPGSTWMSGTLAVTTAEPIARFSVLPPLADDILNLDNLVLTTADVPEPPQLIIFGLGLLLLFRRYTRRIL